MDRQHPLFQEDLEKFINICSRFANPVFLQTAIQHSDDTESPAPSPPTTTPDICHMYNSISQLTSPTPDTSKTLPTTYANEIAAHPLVYIQDLITQ